MDVFCRHRREVPEDVKQPCCFSQAKICEKRVSTTAVQLTFQMWQSPLVRTERIHGDHPQPSVPSGYESRFSSSMFGVLTI